MRNVNRAQISGMRRNAPGNLSLVLSSTRQR